MEAWLGELRPYAGEPRASAGWRLMKSAWRLLRRNRTVALTGLLGGVALALPLIARVLLLEEAPWIGIAAGVAMIAGWTLLAFVVAIATDAELDGLPIAPGEALAEARGFLAPMLRWLLVLVAAWLSLVIAGNVVDLPAPGLILAGWLLATLFVVPAMVILGVGPGAAIAESLRALRERWREALAGLFGLTVAVVLAALPGSALLIHAAALNNGGGDVQYPLLIAGLLLLAVAIGVAAALREAFTVLLLREALADLPGREFGGRRLGRGAKAARALGGLVAVIAALSAFGALTEDDRRVNEASGEPGDNYTTLVANPHGIELREGDCVFSARSQIGVVLGVREEGGGLRVTFHVEPGYGPEETPGSFVLVDGGSGRPYLVLVPRPAPAAPNLSRS